MKAYGIDYKIICLLKVTDLGRDLEVQRFPKPQCKLDFV